MNSIVFSTKGKALVNMWTLQSPYMIDFKNQNCRKFK